MKVNKKKGILFWITGLSGSGKTSVGKKVYKKISKKYGKTILLNGDDLRKIFNLKKFSYNERYKIALSYSKFCENIINQKINIIFTTVSMFNKVREYNKKKIENYVEIYIATNIEDIIKNNKKKIYKWTLGRIPLKRWGDPSEVSNLICFLLSEDSSYINGENINVDGGWLSS